jgi:hypothetical protein
MRIAAAALLLALAALAVGFVVACKRAAQSDGCGSGETANPDPPFCYKVPNGFKQRGETAKRAGWFSIAFADEGKARVDFIVRDLDGFDGRWKALQNNAKGAKATDAKEAEFAEGKGRILTYTTPEKDPKFIVSTMRRGTKHSIECQAEYRTSTPRLDLIDTCKALHAP